jgi:sensor histidine kinase YesM
VEQLAEVFRYTLRKVEKEWVRLDEELEFVAAYLRVEEARFGERLQVTVSVEPAATAIPVPAMSIQPLVENAIKHGTSTVEERGKVGLSVTVKEFMAISCVHFSLLSANVPLVRLVRRCPYRIYRNGSAKSGRCGLFTWSAIGLDLWSDSWNGRRPSA